MQTMMRTGSQSVASSLRRMNSSNTEGANGGIGASKSPMITESRVCSLEQKGSSAELHVFSSNSLSDCGRHDAHSDFYDIEIENSEYETTFTVPLTQSVNQSVSDERNHHTYHTNLSTIQSFSEDADESPSEATPFCVQAVLK